MTVAVACLPRWEEGAAQAGRFHVHLFHGERVSDDVWCEVFEVALGFGRHAVAGMNVTAAVFPGTEDLDAFRGGGAFLRPAGE